MGRPILSSGKKLTGQFFPLGKDLTSQFFPHPVSFFPGQFFPLGKDLTSQFFPTQSVFSPHVIFRKRLETDIFVIVQLNQIKYHSEIAVL